MPLLELNPFDLPLVSIAPPVESITLSSNLDWLDVPVDPLIGPNVNLVLNTKTVNPHLVFSTGAAIGIPSMRLLAAGDIPNIAISQVTGLTDALGALVKTLASANAFLSVYHNAQGDY